MVRQCARHIATVESAHRRALAAGTPQWPDSNSCPTTTSRPGPYGCAPTERMSESTLIPERSRRYVRGSPATGERPAVAPSCGNTCPVNDPHPTRIPGRRVAALVVQVSPVVDPVAMISRNSRGRPPQSGSRTGSRSILEPDSQDVTGDVQLKASGTSVRVRLTALSFQRDALRPCGGRATARSAWPAP